MGKLKINTKEDYKQLLFEDECDIYSYIKTYMDYIGKGRNILYVGSPDREEYAVENAIEYLKMGDVNYVEEHMHPVIVHLPVSDEFYLFFDMSLGSNGKENCISSSFRRCANVLDRINNHFNNVNANCKQVSIDLPDDLYFFLNVIIFK